MARGSYLFFCAAMLVSGFSVADNVSDKNLLQIQIAAMTAKLAEDRGWQKLLHFEHNAYGARRSQVSDPRFFLSPTGSYDAQAELLASLAAFLEPAENYVQTINGQSLPRQYTKMGEFQDNSQHPLCKFPARKIYLEKKLAGFSYWSQLPKVVCTYYDIYKTAVDPESVSFVFSSYYSDNPGSAFGHTFFRINRKLKPGQRNQELLDFGVGFAANVTVSNPGVYALLGLFGGFSGNWNNLPYYYKVREYNDFEARDLWSYDLNLSPDEVAMLSAHLWEVGPTYFTYYFFTQNCSWHMLTILEAAAPRLHLIENVPLYVIPVDSLKALFNEKELVQKISYRPSVRRNFLKRYAALDEVSQNEFRSYAKNVNLPADFTSWSDTRKGLFLDTAVDLLDLRNPELAMHPEKPAGLEKNKILAMRAQVDSISQSLGFDFKESDRPDKSHGTARAGVRYYQNSQSDQKTWLEFRFALHDMLDPSPGMPDNSELEFANIRVEFTNSQAALNQLRIFHVMNINPINFFEAKPSWAVDLNAKQMPYCAAQSCLASGMQFQYGYSWDFGGWIPWLMAQVDLRYGDGFLYNKYLASVGPSVGFLKRLGPSHAVLASLVHEYVYQRADFEDWEAQYRWNPVTSWSLGISFKNQYGGVVAYSYF